MFKQFVQPAPEQARQSRRTSRWFRTRSTEAATAELKGRIQSRLSEAAAAFRAELAAPDIVGTIDDVLSVKDSIEGVSILIEDPLVQEDELVYLKCDGELFNHRDDREITRETAGKPLIFIVPHRFWREHHGTTVRVAYTVERLDDVSQTSAATQVRVEG